MKQETETINENNPQPIKKSWSFLEKGQITC